MSQTTMPCIKPETLSMIERLIGFDTTSRHSNLGLIEWARDYLGAYGIESRLTYDATEKQSATEKECRVSRGSQVFSIL